MPITRLPASANSAWREIDILGVIFAVDLRRNQTRDMHRRFAAPRREFPDGGRVAVLLRYVLRDFEDDVAQMMDLLLPGDVAFRAARILDVFLPTHHFPQR